MFGFNHHRHGHRGWHAMAHAGRLHRGDPYGEEAAFGRGRGGRRRMFEGDELRLVLLALIEQQPRHGYDLIREVEERTGGAYVPSPGVVYPTLTLLDDLGQIEEVKEEGARKRFAITDVGRAALDERRDVAEALLARLAQLAERSARGERAAVKRAMMSLHMAVRTALTTRDAQDRAHDIAAILDEATRRIEAVD